MCVCLSETSHLPSSAPLLRLFYRFFCFFVFLCFYLCFLFFIFYFFIFYFLFFYFFTGGTGVGSTVRQLVRQFDFHFDIWIWIRSINTTHNTHPAGVPLYHSSQQQYPSASGLRSAKLSINKVVSMSGDLEDRKTMI